MNTAYNKAQVRDAVTSKLARYFGTTPEEASEEQVYKSVVLSVKDILTQKRTDFKLDTKKQRGKKIYYLCMEFLIGRSLRNNLRNLGIADVYGEALAEMGFSIDEIYSLEPDPGLGNGGLGRLAACFMDGLTTLDYPATGFSILYEYGLFKQKIIDGDQIELPDIWMPEGDVWLVPRKDKTFTVKFGGHVVETWENGHCDIKHEDCDVVQAVPYDMMISGADSKAVNILRLWKACDTTNFNMNLFSQGQYVKAMEEDTNAEIISKVLYPSDNHTEGKFLRLSQQYFLVSASLQSIIADHLTTYGSLANFSEKVAIHINDTHPALVIPELMRILIDTYSYGWDDAWKLVTSTVSYTNHTVMPEALETWNEDLFKLKLPRIYTIVNEINRRFCAELWTAYPGDWDRISRMSIIGYNQIRMANLSVVGSHTVNGVSKLHSEILKKTIFHDFYKHTPGKFTNVTNGIAHRRWLCYSNPQLSALIDECIGDSWHKQPERLADFEKFASDSAVLDKIDKIKRANKANFAIYTENRTGIKLDPDSVFDVQIKRMHEYKRQLLNALRIISLYVQLKENPDLDITPQTFIFGAKAAPGYYMAKNIIKLISFIAADIEKDPRVREKLRVVFMEDYNVSLAEILIPAADISEQISLAGKEASGTSCMKLMANGALTIGTLDGANVEIFEQVGDENIYIFGLTTEEVDDLWKRGYNATQYYMQSEKLRSAVDALDAGFNGRSFADIKQYLVNPQYSHGIADPYMCLADFESYCNTHDAMLRDYNDREKWNRMSLVNTAKAGIFASDRSIREYADNIWHLRSIK
ncbi:MAG: glycogen/starch/alpha-glucan phosphorylase [Clostridiales bacterium]|nr:glycogen/starch/alpha-glucan phosphorylase [Clostridiales bacterium]